MRRLIISLAASVALTFAMALPIKATGLTLVTVSCSDGDSFSATVDADTLTSLTQTIDAMTLYPAGLSCTLAQTPVLTALGGVASAWLASGFVVGGGRFQQFCPAPNPTGEMLWVNFGLSAHNVEGTTTGAVKGGTFNLAIPAGQCVGESNLTSKPTCLIIQDEPSGPPANPWRAWITSHVTEAHGAFAYLQAQDIGVGVEDNGNPGQQFVNDRIYPTPSPSSCPTPGTPDPDGPASSNVPNGNITIHPQSQL
jgi:hypothetical protein